MTQPLPPSLLGLQKVYLEAQAAAGAAPPPAAAAPPAPVPPGYYRASDGNVYPLQPQPAAAPPPVAAPVFTPPPAAPAPALAPAGFSIPPQQAQALATQHAQQMLPINPPEAQQALLPEAQQAMPEPKKRGRGKAKAAVLPGAEQTAPVDLSTDDLVEILTERGYVVRLEKAAQL